MASPPDVLRPRLAAAMGAALGPAAATADPVLRRAQQPRFGDYQANAAMGLAKQAGRPPREVAEAIVDALEWRDICERVEVAGPGFVNLTLRGDFIASLLDTMASDQRLGVPAAPVPETVVVDYSGPNVAKEMHVGHLRSSVIGDAVVRVLDFAGHRVIRQNHLGDWGTQFGMLIEHLVDHGWAEDGDQDIADLNELYRDANARFDADPSFADRARARVVALQSGDEQSRRLWRRLVEESARHFSAIYRRLGVLLTEYDIRGESFYNDLLDETVAELEAKGLLRWDEGALCAFPPGFTSRDGTPQPLIVRYRAGGYGYAATDLAGIRFRVRELGGTRLAYVVDARQTQHFAMVFAVATAAGWLDEAHRADHVAFGSILGADNRPLRTRAGENVRLAELLDEAVARAAVVVEEKSQDLSGQERSAVARAVGIGAVKYADLVNDRVRDYVFDWDRMMAMDGNTAPYLQYAHARVRSIFRRAEEVGGSELGPVIISEPSERALGLELLSFEESVLATAESLQPHRLCGQLFAVATTFTSFYEQCPVLRAETPELRNSRLQLCSLTASVLATGLALLGIEAPERM